MTPRPTDVGVTGAALYLLPVETRMPLKFGPETTTRVTVARVRLEVAAADGRHAEGWGETPLSVQWVWPSEESYEERHQALIAFTAGLVPAWSGFEVSGHALEVGHAFQLQLPAILDRFRREDLQVPLLAARVCSSPFDLALHDAFGRLCGRPVYETYDAGYLNADLSRFLEPEPGVDFSGLYPRDFLAPGPLRRLPAWHLVGGLDPLTPDELTGGEPDDGHPVLLADWIRRDGLKCLKVKLRGTDEAWDYERLVRVGEIGVEHGVDWLSADFNCTVTEPAYVNGILDRLRDEHPRLYGMVLYVEQPFPYDLESHRIDVHAVSARKPLFMDESAHDWELVRLGRSLGWNGVALKTCKTQTEALLSLCWARAHGMGLMVQDLTNPMLAQVPHVLLAAWADTIMGVETNSMQFYPAASAAEAQVHPGLYSRREGALDLGSLRGAGFGYRLEEIERVLPAPAATAGSLAE
ncbi:MAG: mandelate racemase/muconate lactonizing enzyme family protein [Gemmatimonadaceae bacterium]|nr:mandelate racemase/muconate lactonizing enzyme family protein [Gemmatimonadaceae bacterium]